MTETIKTKKDIIDSIIKFFEENEDVFNDCIEELDGWDGFLGDNRYYAMDDIDELYDGVSPSELLARAFFGHDDDSWSYGSDGNKIYGEFNPNRDYFYYNGYGNLVSADYKDYSSFLDANTIESMANNRAHIDSIDDDEELEELFDMLEEAED